MNRDEYERAYLRALGTRLKVYRVRLGWSQEQVAAAAGVTRNFVSAVERGAQPVDVLRLRLLAAALGTSPSELLAEEGCRRYRNAAATEAGNEYAALMCNEAE